MGLFDKFKKKNYLKRTDFINCVDSNKIWSKSMTLEQIKEVLEYLKDEISKHEFEIDKNFIMNSRRKVLKSNIEEHLLKNKGNKNDIILESVFNFWEFVGDEYFGDFISISRDLGLTVQELTRRDNEYRKKGIICIQEKDIILEIIDLIINYANERNFIEDDGRKINTTQKIKEGKTINKTIKEIEETLSIKLPQDYIEYMQNNNGYTGLLNEEYYNIWKLEDIISMNNNYHVQEFFSDLIYFGSNDGGKAFAFDKSNNMCIVSIPFIGTEEDKKIIANNFNDFIKKIR